MVSQFLFQKNKSEKKNLILSFGLVKQRQILRRNTVLVLMVRIVERYDQVVDEPSLCDRKNTTHTSVHESNFYWKIDFLQKMLIRIIIGSKCECLAIGAVFKFVHQFLVHIE